VLIIEETRFKLICSLESKLHILASAKKWWDYWFNFLGGLELVAVTSLRLSMYVKGSYHCTSNGC
jgi:hypothetical protein